MKALQYVVISLFLLINLLVGSVSYGQVPHGYSASQLRPRDTAVHGITYKRIGWTNDTATTFITYQDPAGFRVFEITSPASKKGLYIVSDFDDKIVLFDNPLQITDSLKAIKALLITVRQFFKYQAQTDSLKRVIRQLINR